jgi:hypothetical protein
METCLTATDSSAKNTGNYEYLEVSPTRGHIQESIE